MSPRKIAHLSDLHCDNTEKWKNNFKHVINNLVAELPQIIIITGDCVNNPFKKSFTCFSEALKNLYIALSKHQKTYIITIPGNHDYFIKGLKPSPRFKTFQLFQSKLLFPQEFSENIDDLLLNIYKDHNISIYPFDSNAKGKSVLSAQGKVDNPAEMFSKFSQMYNNEANRLNRNIYSSFKIGALHHHLLPLPSKDSDEMGEPFMILQNADKFLKAAVKHDIHLLLHGHKHSSSIIRYEHEPEVGSKKKYPLAISACGSTSKLSEPQRELKIINIDDVGAAKCDIFRAFSHNKEFENTHSIELIPYGLCRKIRCYDNKAFADSNSINCIATKRKLIDINKDGSAIVHIDMRGIKWNLNSAHNELKIKETLRADYGRIDSGWMQFGDSHKVLSFIPWRKQDHVDINDEHLMKEEIFDLAHNFDQTHLEKDRPCSYEISYHFLNGYVFDGEAYKELYGNFDNCPEETASIQAHYPTELLELIIKFPEGRFPKEKDFILEAVNINGHENSEELFLLRGNYKKRYSETSLLKHKHSVSVRPFLNEVSFIIRHPQPDLIYTLRWLLPEREVRYIISPEENDTVKKLTEAFSRPSQRLDKLCEAIKTIVESSSSPNSKIEIVILGRIQQEQCLITSASSEPDTNKVRFRMGRGLAGRAMRHRSPIYYKKKNTHTKHNPNRPSPVTHPKVEAIRSNFDPAAVLSLPLIYPFIENSVNPDYSKELYVPPPFAAISIVSHDVGNKLNTLLYPKKKAKDVDEQQKAVNALNSDIWNHIFNNFGDLFPANEKLLLAHK